MSLLFIILGILCLGVGIGVLFRQGMRLRGVILVLLGVLLSMSGRFGCSSGLLRQYEDAFQRQAYVRGFGLGQHLKQHYPGRGLLLLQTTPPHPHSAETIKGLRKGLDGALKVVGQRVLKVSEEDGFGAWAKLVTPDMMTAWKSDGVDIVISFPGLPMVVDEESYMVDEETTRTLWRSPEYQALQWVLPRYPDLWMPGMFREGRAILLVRKKPQQGDSKGFPDYLAAEGTPSELFDTWFSIDTEDE